MYVLNPRFCRRTRDMGMWGRRAVWSCGGCRCVLRVLRWQCQMRPWAFERGEFVLCVGERIRGRGYEVDQAIDYILQAYAQQPDNTISRNSRIHTRNTYLILQSSHSACSNGVSQSTWNFSIATIFLSSTSSSASASESQLSGRLSLRMPWPACCELRIIPCSA